MMIIVKVAVTVVQAFKAALLEILVLMTVAIVFETVVVVAVMASATVPISEVMITCSSNKGAMETLGCPKATIIDVGP